MFASCRHGQSRANSVDIAPPDASDSCILLEQWTIQSVARKWVMGLILMLLFRFVSWKVLRLQFFSSSNVGIS